MSGFKKLLLKSFDCQNESKSTDRGKRRGPFKTVLFSACLGLALPSVGLRADADGVAAVVGEQVAAEDAAMRSQQQIDNLDDESSRMLSEYRQLIAETSSLEIYNTQLVAQTDSQIDEMEDIERQLMEIETTSRDVVPLMQRMLTTLEVFVSLDTPFLVEERKARIENLKDIMRRADVSVSERYRRIVEAYGVEMDYGRTIEAYRTELEINAEARTVDFLRMGRVALLFQTLDGKRTGYWDKAGQKWVVDNTYERSVRDGLRIAKQQASPNLMVVPVSAAREAQL